MSLPSAWRPPGHSEGAGTQCGRASRPCRWRGFASIELLVLGVCTLHAAPPVAWFKAETLTNLSSGVKVASWSDVSGNGYNATQSTASQQPIYVTNVLNGLPAVRFAAASSTWLKFTNPVQDDFTIVAVFASAQGTGTGTLYYQGAGLVNGEVGGTVNDFGTCLFANGQVCAGTGNPDTAVVSGAGFNDGRGHLLTFTRTKSAGEVALFVDGALAGMVLGSTASLTAPTQLALGAQLTASRYLSGDLAEVQVYATALSDLDRQSLERGLGLKYGLLPAAPGGVTVQLLNNQPTLNWSGTTLANSYRIKRATAGAGPFVLLDSTSALSFADTTAVPGTEYFYVVSGIDAAGHEGPASAAVRALPNRYSIYSGPASLCIRSNAGNYDIVVQLTNGTALYQQTGPMAVEVVTTAGAQAWYTAPYTAVLNVSNGVLRCSGTLSSANGSLFAVTDTYRALDNAGTFGADRQVQVTSAASGDSGFSTKLTFQHAGAGTRDDLDLFLPAVWCGDGHPPPTNALGSVPTDGYYWVREDRLPLPVLMLRQTNNGATFWVAHRNPNGSTYKGEDYLARLTDSRMQFGALGLENRDQPTAGFLFPGTEGERTLIAGNGATKRWALRAHPVSKNFAQSYSLAFQLSLQSNYVKAVEHTWADTYALFEPAGYACDLDLVYRAGINVLNRYWSSINGAAGLPFRVPLNGIVSDTNDYNFQIGFTGMQPCNGALLVHEGFLSTNATLRSRGEQMLNFWASNSLTAAGLPRTWYNPIPRVWRSDNTWIRTATDGMLGLLWGWKAERQHGTNQAAWLGACLKFGNWVVSQQAADGSIPRVWSYQTGAVTDAGKYNTSHIVRYLVELYLASATNSYKSAALLAGNYIYQTEHARFSYRGGATDAADKEAVSMSLRAFNALYDMTGDSRWLDAAAQAARYYGTWVYSWQVPIPADDASVVYPANRSTTGLSLIGLGSSVCDSYAATDAFEVYRLYLLTGDSQFLKLARLMLYNTKGGLNWNPSDPIAGFGDPGILNEALQLVPARGHGVGWYLPWQTANYLEPMVNLLDVFGTYDLDALEGTDWQARLAKNNAFALNRGYPSSQAVTSAPSGLRATGQAGQVQLSWNGLPTVRFYNLKRASGAGGAYTILASQTGTNYVDRQVTAGGSYFYVVSALNAGGESADSPPVSATPYGSPTLSAGPSSLGDQLCLFWPDWATNLSLYFTTNLSAPQVWSLVNGLPQLTNGTAYLCLPIEESEHRFFRLGTSFK